MQAFINPCLKCTKKKTIFSKKIIAFKKMLGYTCYCCGMIAVKREVAVGMQVQAGFPWSECQVRKLTTSHCIQVNRDL